MPQTQCCRPSNKGDEKVRRAPPPYYSNGKYTFQMVITHKRSLFLSCIISSPYEDELQWNLGHRCNIICSWGQRSHMEVKGHLRTQNHWIIILKFCITYFKHMIAQNKPLNSTSLTTQTVKPNIRDATQTAQASVRPIRRSPCYVLN